jgi:hypothetical protein
MQWISRAAQTDKLSLIFLSVGLLTPFSEFYYQSSVDGLANGSDAFGG